MEIDKKGYPFKVKILFLFLALYICARVVFAAKEFVQISNLLNLIFLGYFAVLFLIDYKKRLHINDIIIVYAIFTIYCTLSLFWSINHESSIITIKTLILMVINLIVIYSALKEYNLSSALATGVILGSFINYLLAFGIIDLGIETHLNYRFFGTMANPNALGFLMVVSLAISIYYLQKDISYFYKFIHIINIFLALYSIFLTVSRTSLVMGAFLFIVYVISTLSDIKRFFMMLGGLLVAGVIFVLSVDIKAVIAQFENVIYRIINIFATLSGHGAERSTQERKIYIENALDMFSNHPFFGMGVDTFRYFFGGYAHNNFVELLQGVGLVGFMIYYSMHVLLYIKIKKVQNFALRLNLYAFLVILLLIDIGAVTYYDKLLLFSLIFFANEIENENKKIA